MQKQSITAMIQQELINETIGAGPIQPIVVVVTSLLQSDGESCILIQIPFDIQST